MSDLEKVFVEAVPIVLRGESIDVFPMKARQISAFTRAAHPLFGVAAKLLKGKLDGESLIELGEKTDDVIALVAVATGKDAAWIGEVMPDELLKACKVIIEVNTDFFIKVLLPMFVDAAVALRPAQ